MNTTKLVVYDDDCRLCSGLLNQVKKRDTKQLFTYMGRSDFAEKTAANQLPNTLIYINNQKVYTKSNAVLLICRDLGFPYRLLYVLRLVPQFLRDFIYDWVARNRERFNRNDNCQITGY
jgi:predicted DCC family thiol-disulfide oxidoreductase YuxK